MWNTLGICRAYTVGEYFHICIHKAQIFTALLTFEHSQQKQDIYRITCGILAYVLMFKHVYTTYLYTHGTHSDA